MTKTMRLKSHPLGRALVALPFAVAALSAVPALADCAAIDKDLRAAVGAADIGAFEGLHQKMLGEPTCNGDYRERTGRALALAILKSLQQQKGLDAGTYEIEEISQAARYGRPWQVMVAIGDAYYARQQYREAVPALEAAIDDMRDVELNPKLPPKELEVRLFKRAYQARALAKDYVQVSQVRGKPAGLASPKYRNFEVEAVPVPVQFNYNEATLTEQGVAAATDILAYLNSEGIKAVRLIGHTDPVGGEAYNVKLSKDRAAAIKKWLVDYGYKGKVEVVGKGEKVPFEPDDASKYSDEQRHAFDRRVEYQAY